MKILDEVGEPTEAELWSWGGKTMAVLRGNLVLLPRAFTVLDVPSDARHAAISWRYLPPGEIVRN